MNEREFPPDDDLAEDMEEEEDFYDMLQCDLCGKWVDVDEIKEIYIDDECKLICKTCAESCDEFFELNDDE